MVNKKQMLAPTITNGARSGVKIKNLIGVTIHNTDNWSKGAGANNHGTYLQNGGSMKQVSWHYAVDDKMASQSIPENEIAWHAGDGANGLGNTKTIAIEICVNPDSDLTIATDNAAQLTADILKRHGLPATAVFQHHDWIDKNCPSQIRSGKPYHWETFKAKVNQFYNEELSNSGLTEQPEQSNDRKTGALFTCTGLWTQANGGTWYPANSLFYGKGDYSIGKVHKGSEHPYEAVYNGEIVGFANDKCIDDEPTLPNENKETEEVSKPIQPDVPKYGIGTKVTFTGLWTQSNGGTWYSKDKLIVKKGVITKVVPDAAHPYLINQGDGWANDQCIDDEPSVF